MRDLYIVILKESKFINSPFSWIVIDGDSYSDDSIIKLINEFDRVEFIRFNLPNYHELNNKYELTVHNYIQSHNIAYAYTRSLDYMDFINYVQSEIIKKQIDIDNEIKSLTDCGEQ